MLASLSDVRVLNSTQGFNVGSPPCHHFSVFVELITDEGSETERNVGWPPGYEARHKFWYIVEQALRLSLAAWQSGSVDVQPAGRTPQS
jgi:hypothetical protein